MPSPAKKTNKKKRGQTMAAIVADFGRPLADAEELVVAAMASVGCPDRDIATRLDLSEQTLRDRHRVLLEKSRTDMREKLRQTQYRLANGYEGHTTTETFTDPETGKVTTVVKTFPPIAPNPTMCIWLGKQMLSQQDRSIVDTRDVSRMSLEELDAEAKKLGLA